MKLSPKAGTLGVFGSLVVSGVLVASFAPAANAARPAVAPAHTGPMQLVHNFKIGPAGQTTSSNWSGYVATSAGGTYSQVSSTWKEPKVTCTGVESIAVFWVGIDGDPSSTVEQDGTAAICENGTPTYYTWWEMYPTNSVQLVGSTVQPGDKITSSVVRSGSSYALKVVDATHTANTFTMNESCASCLNSSAEWIAERPSGSGGLFPLPNFGRIIFNQDHATSNSHNGSISQFPNDAITMQNGSGQTLAKPGPLKKKGKKFPIKWHQIS